MDSLIEGFGMLIWLVVLGAMIAYGVRHRTEIIRWMRCTDKNMDEVQQEREDRKVKLQREREDIDAEIARIEKAEANDKS